MTDLAIAGMDMVTGDRLDADRRRLAEQRRFPPRAAWTPGNLMPPSSSRHSHKYPCKSPYPDRATEIVILAAGGSGD
jgi:hypothetical protein